MRTFLKIFLCLLVGFSAQAQNPAPAGFPSPFNTNWQRSGWLQSDSGSIDAVRDTLLRPRFAGTRILWQHAGSDTSEWYYTGQQWTKILKTGDAANFALTTVGSGGPATYINGVLNIPIYGGGSGGINSLNLLTATSQTFSVGTSGSDFSIISSGSVHTFSIPTASASARGLLSTSDWTTFSSKQAQLNGTGFVKASGTVITYDNTVYYPNSNPSSFISRTGISALAPILYNNSTGVISADTTTSLTGLATKAFVLENQTSGTITGAGNLPPLFTTSVSANTLLFTLSTVSAHKFYGNNTGSTAVPSFVNPVLASADFPNQGTATTLLHGNAAGNPSWTAVILTTDVSGTLPTGNGGTGLNSFTTGSLFYASSSSVMNQLADVAAGSLLVSGGVGVAPFYDIPGGDLTMDASANFTLNAVNANTYPTNTFLKFAVNAKGLLTSAAPVTYADIFPLLPNGYLKNGLHARNDSTSVWGTVPGSLLDTITTIDGNNAFPVTFANFQAATGRGFRVNFGSDAGWDIFVRDSATGYWTRIPKGSIGQVLGRPPTGGIGWVNQTGGGGSSFTRQTYTSGTTLTVGGGNYIVAINPATTIAALAITLPATLSDMDIIEIDFGGTITSGTVITALTVLAGAGWTILDNTPPGSATADNALYYRVQSSTSTVKRIKL